MKAYFSDILRNLEFSRKSQNFSKISELIGNLGISRKSRNFSEISEFIGNLGISQKSRNFSEISKSSRKSEISEFFNNLILKFFTPFRSLWHYLMLSLQFHTNFWPKYPFHLHFDGPDARFYHSFFTVSLFGARGKNLTNESSLLMRADFKGCA